MPNKLNSQSENSAQYHEEHWISLSDLMTGLMMIFMLIAIAYMVKVEAESKKIKEIAILYDQLRTDLYKELEKEFSADLIKWGADLDKDLTIRFKEPEVLFNTGKADLKPKFKEILDDFFPRYVRVITSEKYKNSITEVRIEGHTSSFWNSNVSRDESYFLNMDLSHTRTRSTLQYIMGLSRIDIDRVWLQKYVTANGLSSSKLIYQKDGSEDHERSQRVEFRVRTDAEARIAKIIEASN